MDALDTPREGWDAVPRRWITTLDAHPFRLMCWLASHTDEYLAGLSVVRVARELRHDRHSVGKWLAQLEEHGLVSTCTVTMGTVERLQITLVRSAWEAPGQPMVKPSPGYGDETTTPYGETGARGMVTQEPPTNSTSSGQNSSSRNTPAVAAVPTGQDAARAYVDTWREQYEVDPPKQNIGRVARDAKALLGEGRTPAQVVEAARLAALEGHANVPSSYSHLVTEGKRQDRYGDQTQDVINGLRQLGARQRAEPTQGEIDAG